MVSSATSLAFQRKTVATGVNFVIKWGLIWRAYNGGLGTEPLVGASPSLF